MPTTWSARHRRHWSATPLPKTTVRPDRRRPILDLVREGHEIVVQVVKDPIGSKGARSDHPSVDSVALPGLLLHVPAQGLGVSVRIEDEAERARLKESLQQLGRGDGSLRVHRANQCRRPDARGARRGRGLSWPPVAGRAGRQQPARRRHEHLRRPAAEPARGARPHAARHGESPRVDSRETFDKIHSFTQQFMPDLADRIEHYPGERPIFDLYGVEDEIHRALRQAGAAQVRRLPDRSTRPKR